MPAIRSRLRYGVTTLAMSMYGPLPSLSVLVYRNMQLIKILRVVDPRGRFFLMRQDILRPRLV